MPTRRCEKARAFSEPHEKYKVTFVGVIWRQTVATAAAEERVCIDIKGRENERGHLALKNHNKNIYRDRVREESSGDKCNKRPIKRFSAPTRALARACAFAWSAAKKRFFQVESWDSAVPLAGPNYLFLFGTRRLNILSLLLRDT